MLLSALRFRCTKRLSLGRDAARLVLLVAHKPMATPPRIHISYDHFPFQAE